MIGFTLPALNRFLPFILTLVPLWSCFGQNTGSLTDPRDGHSYRTIKIGTQTWTAENMAWLPSVDRVGTGLFEEECHYVYGYSGTNAAEAATSQNCQTYGVLYNWMAARSACPEGWRLPTDRDWIRLEKHLGMSEPESLDRDWRTSGETGYKLKATAGWISGNGSDESGFSALPAGCRGYNGFEGMGYTTYFWTASTHDGDNGWRRGLCSDSRGISRQEDRRYFGCSVRCIKK